MKRVWDTFTFHNELDLLEARLIELDGAVYRHVLAEATVTHQGKPKPLYYAENKERFSAWQDKIIHVVTDLPDGGPWDREHAQNEAIGRGLDGMRDDDIFLLSDADEIPRADVLQRAPGYVLPMRHHQLAVNLIDVGWWKGTMGRLGPPAGSIEAFWEQRNSPDIPVLTNDFNWVIYAGWHFSWLGGPEAVRAKAHDYAHEEMGPVMDEVADRLWRDRVSPQSGATRLLHVEVDDSWPRYMQEHRGPASWYWPGA